MLLFQLFEAGKVDEAALIAAQSPKVKRVENSDNVNMFFAVLA